MHFIVKIFVTCFYIGKIPLAPGTLGSGLAILIWYFLSYLGHITLLSFFILYLIFSYKFIDLYLKKSNSDDPSEVIADEVIGQMIPLFIITSVSDHYLILVAFISFRIFDIYKIYPVNKAEGLDGASGVIMDDVVAGIYALIVVFVFKYFLLL
jgi:phosphatidylglycerophosphatase A